ncbi:MAG: hypothetical protein C4305_03265 [Thermoleophilia bacterium]
MALFAALVGYALPDVEAPDPPRPWLCRLHLACGIGLVVACFVVFGPGLRAVAASLFCLALVLVTLTDLEYRLIPNRVVLPAAILVLVLMTAAEPRLEWLLAALAASGALLVLALVYPAGMGMGDVKLALLMGTALGRGVALALLVAVLAAALPSLVILARRGWAGRKVGIPFGPFLALGALVALFAGG